MAKHRDFDPLDPLPADWTDAWQEFWSTLAPNFSLRIKPTDPTVLQVPAGPGNDQVAIGIEANPRFIAATIERASPGGGVVRDLDVWVTSTANVFTPGSPGEVDTTNYAFALAITEVGVLPGGVAIKRKVATAHWDGAKFTSLSALVGPAAVTPAAIGAYAIGDEPPGTVPIGTVIPYAGQALPAGGRWDWADGGLIDRTTFAVFFGSVGHAYNGGVDPGSNKVRKPDKRGRVSVGADSFGLGAAGRLPNSNRARGQNGGEERHTSTSAESGLPAHTHSGSFRVADTTDPPDGSTAKTGFLGGAFFGGALSINNAGPSNASSAHNNLQPYECDNYIVRVA